MTGDLTVTRRTSIEDCLPGAERVLLVDFSLGTNGLLGRPSSASPAIADEDLFVVVLEDKFHVYVEDNSFTANGERDGGIANRRIVKIQQFAVDPK